MKKVILSIVVFGFVGLVCGSARGQVAENIIKLKKSGNCKGCFLGKANLEGANLEGADLKGANLEGAKLKGTNLKNVNLEKANLKGTNLEFDDKNFYRLSVGKADRKKDKIKGAKKQKKVKGAKKTTEEDLVRMCRRKAAAAFRKCAKGSRGGNAGGNFLAHTGLQKAAQKRYARLRQPTMTM